MGDYGLLVRSITVANIIDATPASYSWQVVEPATFIVAGPPASTLDTTATFRFASTDPAASYECALDAGLFGSCESEYLLEGLTIGQHELQVRAVSTAGTLDLTPAIYIWTVAAPETTIDSGPPQPTWQTHASFTFSSTDLTTAEFECSLDGALFGSCESPYQVTSLLPGNHEFRVRAKNIEGGVDPTPALLAWTINALPDTTITDMPGEPERDDFGDVRFHLRPVGRDLRVLTRRGRRRRDLLAMPGQLDHVR